MNHNNETFIAHDFSNMDLQQVTFQDCQFYLCRFDRADLRDAKFVRCSFIEPRSLEGCSFQHANLKDVSFLDCNLAMSQFVGADCFGAEFRQCDLKGANFQRANFVNRINHKSYFCSIFITGCNLTYSNFERALMEKCDLFENRWNGANLFGVSFLGADLSRGEFSSEQWQSANFEQADLTHVDLEGVDLRKTSLYGAKICDWQQQQLLESFGLILV
ncbi:hypothetical protein VISI1226_09919 [Vibrio sinaloensis DSM 21326]|uniref:Fluoroquinolone resistance protein n=1 Tax=Vibrio sinaloensis DSM 21326 TaxID=945550 RepID=E8M9D2_PHOS4|nr:Qnr family pentapeptide repeat protein [Vibrio sinaloensis]EGA69488.1 hypothetical protein VISI1226_09919 [Vibrio sinaloensis DSM 21326]